MAADRTVKQRTCIGCGKKAPKGDLIRIVRASDEAVLLDGSERAPGRGAYVCSAACFSRARKACKLQGALKMNVSNDDAERIEAGIAALCAAHEA